MGTTIVGVDPRTGTTLAPVAEVNRMTHAAASAARELQRRGREFRAGLLDAMADTPEPVRRRGWMLPRLPLKPARWSWQLSARCRGEDPAIFFHPEGERGKARQRRARKAKAICAQCPVAALCRDHALRFQEPFGIWGGLSEDERFRLLSAPKLAPSKHP